MNDDGKWVTINGTHVFIENGQSPMDAFIRQKGKNKKITLKDFNHKYREYLRGSCSGKGKFGLYSITLKNGKLLVASSLKDLEEDLLKEIEKNK